MKRRRLRKKVNRITRINIERLLCINGRKIKGKSLNSGEREI